MDLNKTKESITKNNEKGKKQSADNIKNGRIELNEGYLNYSKEAFNLQPEKRQFNNFLNNDVYSTQHHFYNNFNYNQIPNNYNNYNNFQRLNEYNYLNQHPRYDPREYVTSIERRLKQNVENESSEKFYQMNSGERFHYNYKDNNMELRNNTDSNTNMYPAGIPNTRHRTTSVQLNTLEEVAKTVLKPDKAMRVKLASQLGMSQRQVQIWFQNKRAKLKKETTDVKSIDVQKREFDRLMDDQSSLNSSFQNEDVSSNKNRRVITDEDLIFHHQDENNNTYYRNNSADPIVDSYQYFCSDSSKEKYPFDLLNHRPEKNLYSDLKKINKKEETANSENLAEKSSFLGYYGSNDSKFGKPFGDNWFDQQ